MPDTPSETASAFWLHDTASTETFAAFRSRFRTDEPRQLVVRSTASGPCSIWIDGALVAEGPVRARRGVSALAETTVACAAGEHVVAMLCHHEGVATRIMEELPPHVRCSLHAPRELALEWRAVRLDAYECGVRRINPELGWVDWCDTRRLPADWREVGYDDREWAPARRIALDGWTVTDAGIGAVSFDMATPAPVSEGYLAERYGYERDDPPARFLLRELTGNLIAADPARLPSQGVWRRFDAGAIALIRPEIDVDVPAGTIVEVAYCEELHEGRVNPFVTLSLGPTCNLDHYVARGGRQRIEVSGYRGGRYVEVHLLYPPDQALPESPARAFGEGGGLSVRTRTYYPNVSGGLATGDTLLDRIWAAGARTLASCTEDAVDDCPTRERGQWLGDVVTVGAQIAGAAFGDLRVFRKALVDAALSARDDGMVAGLCPGTVDHIPSYAATWVEGVVRYVDLTGDRSVLELLYAAMVRNVDALAAFLGPDGMTDRPDSAYPLGWVFVDWGYVPNAGPSDMVLNMHLLNAVRSALRWHELLEAGAAPTADLAAGQFPDGALAGLLPTATPSPTVTARFREYEARVTSIVRRYVDSCLEPDLDWSRLGYHRAVLAMRHGLIPERSQPTVLDAIARHQDRCFPNDPSAPRNDSPFRAEPRLITPYFYHYAMPLFAEADRMDYVLGQYRSCWGWLLSGGYTTLCEVFDRRWSQCHQWSGSPTWQLSRYLLGLAPEFSRGRGTFRFTGRPHALRVSGRIPIAGTDAIVRVATRCEGDTMELAIETPRPIAIVARSSTEARGASTTCDDRAVAAAGTTADTIRLEPGRHTITGSLADGTIITGGRR